MKRDASSVLPDQASLFIAHETIEVPSLYTKFHKTGFELGQSFALHALQVEWADVDAVAAFPCWPRFRIAWRHIGGVTCREYRPLSARDNQRLASDFEALAAHVHLHRAPRLSRGWLAAPSIAWTPTERWPGEAKEEASGYRANALAETLVAQSRDDSSSLDRFVVYVRGGTNAVNAHFGDLALSETHLYRRHRGKRFRIERSALRARREPAKCREVLPSKLPSLYPADGILHQEGNDRWFEHKDLEGNCKIHRIVDEMPALESPSWAKYTFGRNLDVIVRNPRANAVATLLDEQLDKQG